MTGPSVANVREALDFDNFFLFYSQILKYFKAAKEDNRKKYVSH